MTQGRPGAATALLLCQLHEVGFRFRDTGCAASTTGVMLALLAGVALPQLDVLDRRTE